MTVKSTIKKVDAIRDKERSKIEEIWNTGFDMKRFAAEGMPYARQWAKKVLMPEATKTLTEAVKEAKK